MKTAACAPLKHHYDECAARVQRQEEEQGKAQEDCVEECEYRTGRLFMHRCPSICLLWISADRKLRLPHDALRRPMRRTEAIQAAAIDDIEHSTCSRGRTERKHCQSIDRR